MRHKEIEQSAEIRAGAKSLGIRTDGRTDRDIKIEVAREGGLGHLIRSDASEDYLQGLYDHVMSAQRKAQPSPITTARGDAFTPDPSAGRPRHPHDIRSPFTERWKRWNTRRR